MKIGIITPVKNASDVVLSNIASVYGQDSKIDSHTIVYGKSTDKTMETIDDAINRLNANRITVINDNGSGLYGAINIGIDAVESDIIGILNADDFYPKSNIISIVRKVFSDPAIDACYGDLKYVQPHNVDKVVRYWRSGEYVENKFYYGWMPPHPTFFVRSRVYRRFGSYRLDMGTAADYEFMLRVLLRNGIRVKYIPDVLVHMRSGGVSNSKVVNRIKANKMDRRAWEVNGLRPYLWTIPMKPLRKIGQWVFKG